VTYVTGGHGADGDRRPRPRGGRIKTIFGFSRRAISETVAAAFLAHDVETGHPAVEGKHLSTPSQWGRLLPLRLRVERADDARSTPCSPPSIASSAVAPDAGLVASDDLERDDQADQYSSIFSLHRPDSAGRKPGTGITPHIPVWNISKREEGILSR